MTKTKSAVKVRFPSRSDNIKYVNLIKGQNFSGNR